jgi:hypothetical protein
LAPGLALQNYTRQERLGKDKRLSLFGLFISDEEKLLKTLAPEWREVWDLWRPLAQEDQGT